MTGVWEKAKWHFIHGDRKSFTGGRWKMRTMLASDGQHRVQILEHGAAIYTKDYKEEPSFEEIVADIQIQHDVKEEEDDAKQGDTE